ncbi:opsin 8, group member c [Anoplopoma fimbria]|uniref:opsin 8, group member c n=1 Tax=Anoplopoma fimbria TaxID=229290 RepID=UPI0023EDA2C9|nr:opsin 8, group member c [Anoplopoma fimbria]XP_054474692.1 opsin 8, group member c [Anoplopoma fimbria]XP_054474693.1 opsin 8, group member c [Anoplopoma fimbria]
MSSDFDPLQRGHHSEPLQPMNSSDNRTISAFTSKLTPAADICVGLAIVSVVVLSVLGNGLVLVICYRRRKKMVGSELLCVNLAVVDFLCCICFYPLSIMSSFNHMWLGENITCVYYGLGCFIFGLCSMFTITAISITRYLKTCIPVYAVWLEGTNIRKACCAIWLVAAVWSSFPLFGWGEYVPEPYGLSCTIAWRGYHTSAKDAFYVICSFACFTMVPVLLIVVSQCQILYKVSRFSNSLAARGIRNKLRHAEKRLSMMFFCISLGFVVAWAPYAVVSLLFIFHRENQYMAPGGFVFPALFAKSSHIYNPFIYFYFNKTFRKELRCLILSLWPKLGGNQVGVHIDTVHQLPIHIQLQERACVQKRTFSLTQDRTCSKGKGKGKGKVLNSRSNPVPGRPVYACWGSTSNNAPITLDNKVAKDSPSVSI